MAYRKGTADRLHITYPRRVEHFTCFTEAAKVSGGAGTELIPAQFYPHDHEESGAPDNWPQRSRRQNHVYPRRVDYKWLNKNVFVLADNT